MRGGNFSPAATRAAKVHIEMMGRGSWGEVVTLGGGGDGRGGWGRGGG